MVGKQYASWIEIVVCILCISSTTSCGPDGATAGETAESSGAGTTAASDVSTSSGMGATSNGVDDSTSAASEASSGGSTGGSSSGNASAVTESETSGAPSSAYERDIQPIWDESCVNGAAGTACHAPGGEWATLDLTPAVSYDSLLNGDALETLQPFVAPGDPDGSYVWHKINGTWQGPPSNGVCCDQPPPDGVVDPGPLSDEQLDLIEQWIIDGAPA